LAVLEYRLDVLHPANREILVTLEVTPAEAWKGAQAAGPSSDDQSSDGPFDLFLPTWTPGSYLIREFSRHLGRVEALEVATGMPVRCEKVTKNRFRLHTRAPQHRLRITWTAHAHELSVRTADLTAEHAYWNHACVLLWPVNGRALDAGLTVAFPAGWELATALPTAAAPRPVGDGLEIVLRARDLDHAMDSPCLAGRFRRLALPVAGVVHEVVLEGLGPVEVPGRLSTDLAAVIAQAASVFGGALPYAGYTFLCLFAADGHGGLEHAESTTLLMGRTALTTEKGYREFLSLAAHELFHAWNVKRLRPAEFWLYDYENENYTGFLWLIEGWTAYYDDLLCQRAGVFTRAHYLEAAAKNVQAMLAAPGRFRSSLCESSFDAWIRLYRPDANSRNSSQNYYVNGAVAAMCLDLWLRRESQGRRSLDDVLRGLYRTTFENGRGYGWQDVHDALREAGGDAAIAWLGGLVLDRLDPALQEVLGWAGVRVRHRDTDRPYLGVHFDGGTTVVASVTHGSPAFTAGLHPGDEILAVASLRVDGARWADVWNAVAKVGTPVPVLFARRGIVGSCQAVPLASPGSVSLEIDEAADAGAKNLLAGWLPEAARSDGAAAKMSNPSS
jgi:predicted metalloprotease with PDZ domain